MQFTPHRARNVLSPHFVDKAITQSLSEFECLNYAYHQWDSHSPLGRAAHRRKALDAYSIMSSLDLVSIGFWALSSAAPRRAPNAWPFPYP